MLKTSSILRQILLNFDYILVSLSGEIKRSSSLYYFTSETKPQNYSEGNVRNNAVITKVIFHKYLCSCIYHSTFIEMHYVNCSVILKTNIFKIFSLEK